LTEPGFDELLRRLVAAEVRFVLVGGLALSAWGVVRGTKDVDIVVDPEPANLDRLAEEAVRLGGSVRGPEALAGSSASIAALLAAGDRVLINTPIGPIDVVHGLEGVPSYSELLPAATEVEVLGVYVHVCSLADLRAMKRAAGRTRDLADLEDLEDARPDDH
jgi:predicted nucleotidyltransferase